MELNVNYLRILLSFFSWKICIRIDFGIVFFIRTFRLTRKLNTVKPVYDDQPRDSKIVAVVDRWSLFRGHLCNKSSECDYKMVVDIRRWSGSGLTVVLKLIWHAFPCIILIKSLKIMVYEFVSRKLVFYLIMRSVNREISRAIA